MADSHSPTDIDPSGLTYSDYELNFPSQNILSISLRFHTLADLLLDNNTIISILDRFSSLWNSSDLQALADDNGGQLEFFVATSEHVQQPDFMDFLRATNATRIFVLRFNQLEGKIRLLVGTPDQLSNPLVIDGIRNFHKKLRAYTYHGQYRESSGMKDEEAAEILGSPTSWIAGFEEAEIDCAICLDSIERGVEVKALACKHVYHYACILRSTKRKQQCPLCRASYDYRQTQLLSACL
ncbi:hypothetical protein SUGI_0216920 [Cryptomeria japonica]|nr:hypothetical protein SUGI_0216920 [Cryptomeria japonica]